MMKFNNSFTNQIKNKKFKRESNKGFSLIELLVVIAIMVVLIGVIVPTYMSYMHKARVAKDWANLRAYYDEAQADFISTGEVNPVIFKDLNYLENWQRTEIEYLDGTRVKLSEGYFAVTMDSSGSGYHIAYQCNKYLSDMAKHSGCTLVLGASH